MDPQEAIDACKFFLTQYIAQQPHITEFSGADPELVKKIKGIVGWPATTREIKQAMKYVSNELTQSVCACGTTTQAVDKLKEYINAGTEELVLVPRGEKVLEQATVMFKKGRLAGM